MCGLELLGDDGGGVILMIILVRDSTELHFALLQMQKKKKKVYVLGNIKIKILKDSLLFGSYCSLKDRVLASDPCPNNTNYTK